MSALTILAPSVIVQLLGATSATAESFGTRGGQQSPTTTASDTPPLSTMPIDARDIGGSHSTWLERLIDQSSPRLRDADVEVNAPPLVTPLRIAQAPASPVAPLMPEPRDSPFGNSTFGRAAVGLAADADVRVANRTGAPPSRFETNAALPSSLFEPSVDSSARLDRWGGSDLIAGAEAVIRQSNDVGGLLFGSQSANGIAAQQRNAITHDVRIRGAGNSQNIGAGSYWNPGRPDLDTALNKIFAHNIETLTVTKGPYSVRYGPGFNFVDMQLKQSPRYRSGASWDGNTRLNFDSNGDRWSARQTLSSGGRDWGAHVSYGHSGGSDYLDGSDFLIPNSYKSRDLYATLGLDLSDSRTIEFSYIRLDQTDVEFPGLVFDIDFLVTDGFELDYEDRDSAVGDRFKLEVWYNRTRFEGSTLRPSKNWQIPALRTTLFSPDGSTGFALTDVDGSSVGYRVDWTWDLMCAQLAIGTDLIYLDQTLNDREPLLPANDNNFPVPHSNSSDIGCFVDYTEQVGDTVTVHMGSRVDFVQTRSSDFVDGVLLPLSTLEQTELDQTYALWATYLTGEWAIDSAWTAFAGGGFSQRPPSLTELYAEQSFIGTLQRGLSFVDGDPLLDPERLKQVDLGLRFGSDGLRGSLTGFYAWIDDFITFDRTSPADGDGGLPVGVTYVNTDLATLAGFEFDTVYDVSRALTLFAKMQFVEGRDHGRNRGARLLNDSARSGITGRVNEPLPGIAPLEARLGLRLHDPTPAQLWGTELTARIVDRQDRIAVSLEEIATPGFTVWDFRSYWQLTDQMMLLTGVENITDKFYREHLDYRSGFGVYRRGVSFYVGLDIAY